MIQQNTQEAANVPTFTFSLANINPQNIPELFHPSQKQSKRIPGSITNLRKTTVSQLLQVFRPEQSLEQQQFRIKKQLVTNAISAIYQSKKCFEIAGKIKKHNLLNLRQHKERDNSFQKDSSEIYKTPQKNFTRSINSSTATTKRSTKRSSSQSKLNYSRNQHKFDESEIEKLRKRAGCIG